MHLAFDGEQALAEQQRLTPQICLLDIGMPRLSGYAVARAIRSQRGRQPMLTTI